MLFLEEDNRDGLAGLKEQEFKEEEEEEEQGLGEQDIIMEGLETIDFQAGEGLIDNEQNKQKEYDGQLEIRDINEPPQPFKPGGTQARAAELLDREQGKQPEFDAQAVLREMDER